MKKTYFACILAALTLLIASCAVETEYTVRIMDGGLAEETVVTAGTKYGVPARDRAGSTLSSIETAEGTAVNAGDEILVDGDITLYYSWTEPGDWEFIPVEGGFAAAKYRGDEYRVTVPSMHEGLPVVEIGHGALDKVPNVRTLIIPEGVERIEQYSICWLKDLVRISLPSTVVSMRQILNACPELEEIALAEGSSAYMVKDGCLIDKSAKMLITGTKDSIIPDDGSVTRIGPTAFEFSKRRSIDIPRTVTVIDWRAFYGSENLSDVRIGNPNIWLGENAFGACPFVPDLPEERFLDFHEQPEGYAFHSYRGYSKDVVIPDTWKGKPVIAIAPGAMEWRMDIESVVIPSGVREIGKRAFGGCRSLRCVTIENPGCIIAPDAFEGCPWQPDVN